MKHAFDLYSTAHLPSSGNQLQGLGEAARRAELDGYDGVLVFHNHQTPDPWVVASAILQQTEKLTPLVALQPQAVPPHTAAKMIASLVGLYGRRVDVNLVIGATRAELDQLGDATAHDQRYERATEYLEIVSGLLASNDRLSHQGRHYRFHGLRMNSRLDPDLRPRIFVAGSSAAGRAAAGRIGDVAITHPEPVAEFESGFLRSLPDGLRAGIRLGLLARPTDEQAWEVVGLQQVDDRAAHVRTMHKMRSESSWLRALARLAGENRAYDGVYWPGAIRGKGSIPFLVGSYGRVADYLSRYLAAGVSTVILGRVHTTEEFDHAAVVLDAVRCGSHTW